MSLALARALIVSELVPRARMGRFLARAVRQSKSLAVVLAEEDEELVLAALGKDPTPLVPEIEIDRALLARLPVDLPERLGLAPLTGYSDADLVAVAMMDPTDRNAALEVERILQTSVMRVRVRPLLLRKALMEIAGSRSERVAPATNGPPTWVDTHHESAAGGAAHAPHESAATYSSPASFDPETRQVARLPGNLRPLGPGEYRLEHPGFALLGSPVVQDAVQEPSTETAELPVDSAPAAVRTPPFGSRSVPVFSEQDDPEEADDEPIPLVRKASSPQQIASWRESVPAHSPPVSVRHARTLAPPPSMSAPPPSFSAPVPPDFARPPSIRPPSIRPPSIRPLAPPPESALPPRPPRSITPTAIPSIGLHAFTRMSLEEYTARLGMLRTAKHRDDVTGELLTLAHAVAEQAIVLAAKGERYTGWSGSLSLGNVRSIEVSAREPTVFTRAALEDGFLGQLVPMPAHRALLEKLHGHSLDAIPAPIEVAVWPVVVAKRPVLFLLAARLTDPLVATQRFSEMCRAASQGLYRLLRGGR